MHEAVGFLWAAGSAQLTGRRCISRFAFAYFIVLPGKRLEVVTRARRAFHVRPRCVVGVNPRFVLLRLFRGSGGTMETLPVRLYRRFCSPCRLSLSFFAAAANRGWSSTSCRSCKHKNRNAAMMKKQTKRDCQIMGGEAALFFRPTNAKA